MSRLTVREKVESAFNNGKQLTDAQLHRRASLRDYPGSTVRTRRKELVDDGVLEFAGITTSPRGRTMSLWRQA